MIQRQRLQNHQYCANEGHGECLPNFNFWEHPPNLSDVEADFDVLNQLGLAGEMLQAGCPAFKIIFICVEGDFQVNRAKSEIEVDMVLKVVADEATEVGGGAEQEGVSGKCGVASFLGDLTADMEEFDVGSSLMAPHST
jgi:hypothetical protein